MEGSVEFVQNVGGVGAGGERKYIDSSLALRMTALSFAQNDALDSRVNGRHSMAKKKLVEADEVGLAFYGLEDAGDLFGGGVRLAVGADADPVAGGAFEVDDVGAGIFALQLLVESAGVVFMMEDADLDAPSS